MPFYKDWRFYTFLIALISLLSTIGLGFVGRWIYFKIKTNDFYHLNLNFTEFKKNQREDIQKLFGKIDGLSKHISGLSGTCKERDIRLKNLENKKWK